MMSIEGRGTVLHLDRCVISIKISHHIHLCFNDHFLCEPGLASSPIDSLSLAVPEENLWVQWCGYFTGYMTFLTLY